MCKTICNGISKGCESFFSQRKSAYDIQRNYFAAVDLSPTKMSLLMNTTNNETNYPIFMSNVPPPPPTQHQHQQQNTNIINNSNKRQQEQDPNRRTRVKQEEKASFATAIPTFWTDILDKYKTA